MEHCCWTCGHEADSLKSMQDHMREAHEEGRDYIVCPFCSRLVIDMVVHAQGSHRGLSLPPMQMRITGRSIDFRAAKAAEMKKKGRRKYHQGFFQSDKNNKQMHYRSGWERDVYKILENSFAVTNYYVEPFPIQYVIKNVIRNYWPDILVTFVDDTPFKPSRAVIEVKPLSQCPDKEGKVDNSVQETNEAKWQAANKLCQKKGWDFVVWTERSITKLSTYHKDALSKVAMIGCSDTMNGDELTTLAGLISRRGKGQLPGDFNDRLIKALKEKDDAELKKLLSYVDECPTDEEARLFRALKDKAYTG